MQPGRLDAKPMRRNAALGCKYLEKRGEQIAAKVLVHGIAVVARNVDDFKFTRATIVNLWEPFPLSPKDYAQRQLDAVCY